MSLRYRIPFKSLSGIDCKVDIYDNTYTGDYTLLSPSNAQAPGVAAANPVEIDENDDESMLTVLRPKTGYISLIELQYGALNSLYPLTNNQCSVEIYYGSELVFYGFIQAQGFENNYGPAPRQLHIPIFTPLGMMDNQYITNDPLLGSRMIGDYLDSILNYYDDVIIPRDLVTTPDDGVVTPLQIKINTRTACPWNNDYNYGTSVDGTTPSVYTPITYTEFLEAFCNLYGLVAHEYGKTIIFSSYTATCQYVKMQVGDLTEDTMDSTDMPTGDSTLSIESYFSPAGAEDTEGAIMPLGKLTYDYGDIIETVPMDLSRSKYIGRVSLSRYEDFGTLAILNPQTNEFYSSILSIEGGDQQTTQHVRVLGDGDREMVEMNVYGDQSAADTTEIFRYTFTNVPTNITGAKIESTFQREEDQALQSMRIQVISGGKYYNTDHEWVTTPSFLPITFDKEGNCTTYHVSSNGHTITVKFFPPAGGNTFSVAGMITSMELETFADPLRRYEIPIDKEKTVINDTPSDNEATVYMLFNNNGQCPNRVIGGYINRNTYAYLFKSQQRQVRHLLAKQATSIPLLYLRKLTTIGYILKWRLIALSFNPWNDEWRMTIHGSTTI